MGKEITVRQNRCEREMDFFLFGLFFLFALLQTAAAGLGHDELADRICMLLRAIAAPGFFFCRGYRFHKTARREGTEAAGRLAYRSAAEFFAYFLLLAFGQKLLETGFSVGSSVSAVLTLTSVPSVSALFLSLTIALIFAGFFAEKLYDDIEHRTVKCAVAGGVCLLCALLCAGQKTYPLFASVLGAAGQDIVPAVPYFAFFLLGMWFEGHLPGFRLSFLGASAAASVLAVFLCRTPAKSLGVVMLGFLPVYLLYLVSEGCTELTLRFRTAGFLWDSAKPVFLSSVVLTLCAVGAKQAGILEKLGLKGKTGSLAVFAASAAAPLLIYLAIWLLSLCGRLYERGLVWFETRVKHRTAVYFLLFYTPAFALMMALVFFTFLLLRRSFVWAGDGLTQYYPRAVYFSKYIRELLANFLQGNFTLPMYDFRNGMGSEIIYSFEPLYFLHVLFDENHMEFAYNLVTILRFYLAGITSSVLFLYFKKKYFPAFLGSAVYIFCGFALYGGAKHTMFMIPLVMLPLLIIAVEEILRGRRWYLCTVFVAISLFSNYYFLYMNTIAMGVYFLVRFFCLEDKSRRTFRNFLAKGLTLSGSYLLGVAMSCIVLVTTFGSYIGSSRGEGAVVSTPSLLYYSGGWLVRCFLCFITTASSPGNWLKLGYLPIALLAAVFLYTQKGRREQKILFAVSMAFMALPAAAFVFSGFSSVINRWCYMISLLVAFIVADCLPDMLRMKRRSLWVCGGAVLLYGFLAFAADESVTHATSYTRLGFVALAATFAVLLVCQDSVKKPGRGTKRALLLVLTFGLLFCQGFTEFMLGHDIDKYMGRDKTQSRITKTPVAAVSEIEDDSFFRAAALKLDYLTSSSSLLLGYNPITTVSSVLNGSIQEYLNEMGGTSHSVVQLLGLDNRTMLQSLAAVKYNAKYAAQKRSFPAGSEKVLDTKVNGRRTIVAENKYAMPLGYTYSGTISEEELEQYSTEERQEVLMQKVMLESADGSDGAEAEVTGKRLELQVTKEKGLSLEENALVPDKEKKKHSLKLSFEGLPNSETYLVIRGANLVTAKQEASSRLSVKAGKNRTGYTFSSEGNRYRTGQSDYVINLGYRKKALTSCTIRLGGKRTLEFDDFYIYCQPMDGMEQYTQALTEDVLEHVELGTNTVRGDIDLDEDKTLVFSIPYQKGWTALVDGSPVKLERANYMYMALPLAAGSHTVELTFEIPGVKYALVIMPCAVVLFIILCLATWIAGKKRKRKHTGEQV